MHSLTACLKACAGMLNDRMTRLNGFTKAALREWEHGTDTLLTVDTKFFLYWSILCPWRRIQDLDLMLILAL